MCGIFAYLNYLTPKTRKEIVDFLITGLQRLEYRGYDSAGIGIDGAAEGEARESTTLIKKKGKVKNLQVRNKCTTITIYEIETIAGTVH